MTIIRVDQVQTHAGAVRSQWELIETQVASADSTIDVINLGSHVMYKFFWTDLDCSVNWADFWIRTDSNNGASFDAGVSDYAWGLHYINNGGGTGVYGDNADSEIVLWNSHGNAANELSGYEITLFNPSGTEYTKFKWESNIFDENPITLMSIGAGMRLSAAAVDAVQFRFDTGTFSGTLKVYGLNAG